MMIFSFDYFEFEPSGKKKYKSLKVSTGENVQTKDWDLTNQKPKKNNGNAELTTRLRDLETTILTVYRRMVNDGQSPTPLSLKQAFLKERSGDKHSIPASTLLLPFIDQFITQCDRKEWTKKGYRTTQQYLTSYQGTQKAVLRFEDIDLDFYDSFVRQMKEQGKAPNTIGKHIKNIKVFMNNAIDRGLTESRYHQNKRFVTIEEESESIYLNYNELSKLHKLDLSNNSRLESVRDLFLIDAFTGVRFGDMSEIKNATLYSDDAGSFLRVKTLKTGETVVIPIHPIVREILTKYGWNLNNLPRMRSNQKMNLYIKEIGLLAGLTDEIVINPTKGYLKAPKKAKKCDLMMNHTARRSFATNAYLAGVPKTSIMKLTGHRTERSFMKYIKISPEENARLVAQHPFFSGLNIA